MMNTLSRLLVVAVAVASLAAGCAPSRSSRCKQLCQKQIECIESLPDNNTRIDENECTSACSVLERASEGKKRVDEFAACVERAGTCEALLRCR